MGLNGRRITLAAGISQSVENFRERICTRPNLNFSHRTIRILWMCYDLWVYTITVRLFFRSADSPKYWLVHVFARIFPTSCGDPKFPQYPVIQFILFLLQSCKWKFSLNVTCLSMWEQLVLSAWHSLFKGTVQRKLAGVESDINWKVFLWHWTADISSLNFKGTCSLSIKKLVSAAKAKIGGLYNSMGRALQITNSGKPTSW